MTLLEIKTSWYEHSQMESTKQDEAIKYHTLKFYFIFAKVITQIYR